MSRSRWGRKPSRAASSSFEGPRARKLLASADTWLDEAVAAPERIAEFVAWLGRFRNRYATRNRVLAYLQDPEATALAGRRAWEREFRRPLLPGARPVWILAPGEAGELRAVAVYDVRFTRGPALFPERPRPSLDALLGRVRAACPHRLARMPLARAIAGPGAALAWTLSGWAMAETDHRGTAEMAAAIAARWLGVEVRQDPRAYRRVWSSGHELAEAVDEAVRVAEAIWQAVQDAGALEGDRAANG